MHGKLHQSVCIFQEDRYKIKPRLANRVRSINGSLWAYCNGHRHIAAYEAADIFRPYACLGGIFEIYAYRKPKYQLGYENTEATESSQNKTRNPLKLNVTMDT